MPGTYCPWEVASEALGEEDELVGATCSHDLKFVARISQNTSYIFAQVGVSRVTDRQRTRSGREMAPRCAVCNTAPANCMTDNLLMATSRLRR